MKRTQASALKFYYLEAKILIGAFLLTLAVAQFYPHGERQRAHSSLDKAPSPTTHVTHAGWKIQ